MASEYDDLDASSELEQALTAALALALESRGCEVVHNGTAKRHAGGGKADIEVVDKANKRLILVEVTRRKGSAADGEFPAITDHLEKAIRAGGYNDYCTLYVSPATSARMSTKIRDLWNRSRERDGLAGRVLPMSFEGIEMMLTTLALAPSEMYPASRIGDLFDAWPKAVDDAQTKLLVQRTMFPEDTGLAHDLEHDADQFVAERERQLRNDLVKVENYLREYGVTGNEANVVLTLLTFLRLYEERRQRETGATNRFTLDQFEEWAASQPASTKNLYPRRMVEALIHEVAEDPDLVAAGLLRDGTGAKVRLNPKIEDRFVTQRLLPIFDEYDFYAGRVDLLGAVFETLARRSEKDTRVGQFFTPQPVVDFCARTVPLTARDTVLDPAVGTARFLIQAMNRMLAVAGDGSEPRAEAERAIREERLIGTDIGDMVASIAKMNMLIHGDGKTNIREVNGLILSDTTIFPAHPNGLAGQVDVVLTNPPLGETSFQVAAEHWRTFQDDEDADASVFIDRLGVVPTRVVEVGMLRTAEQTVADSDEQIEDLEAAAAHGDEKARKTLITARRTRATRAERVATLKAALASGDVHTVPIGKTMKGGALFLGAIADYLKPVRDSNELVEWRGGWAAIVVDEAILNTPDYAATRRFIRDRFYVKAVVSLGRDAFQHLAKTRAKTSVMFLIRKPETGKQQREPIFYAHAERVGYGPTGDWIGDDLPQIEVEMREVHAAVRSRYTKVHLETAAAMEAVEAVPGFASAFQVVPDEGGDERLDYYHARYAHLRRELQEQYDRPLPTLGDYIEPVIEHPEEHPEGLYDFATIHRETGTVHSKGPQTVKYNARQLRVVHPDDLVVSGIDIVNGSVGVAGQAIADKPHVLSKEFFMYRPKQPDTVDMHFLSMLLRSRGSRRMLEGMITGTSNRTRLQSSKQLLGLPIPPLPSIDEQRRIAEGFVSAHDAELAARQAQRDIEAEVNATWVSAPDPMRMDDRLKIDADPEDALRTLLRSPRS